MRLTFHRWKNSCEVTPVRASSDGFIDVGIQFDGGGVSVLHAAAGRAAREVIDEGVGVEGTVVHPTGGGGDDLVQRGDDLCHVVVGGVGVDDDAEVAAGFVEVGFLKVADLDRRVDQAVVIRGAELAAGRRGREEWRCAIPRECG